MCPQAGGGNDWTSDGPESNPQFHYGLVTLLSFAHTVDTAWV